MCASRRGCRPASSATAGRSDAAQRCTTRWLRACPQRPACDRVQLRRAVNVIDAPPAESRGLADRYLAMATGAASCDLHCEMCDAGAACRRGVSPLREVPADRDHVRRVLHVAGLPRLAARRPKVADEDRNAASAMIPAASEQTSATATVLPPPRSRPATKHTHQTTDTTPRRRLEDRCPRGRLPTRYHRLAASQSPRRDDPSAPAARAEETGPAEIAASRLEHQSAISPARWRRYRRAPAVSAAPAQTSPMH